MPRVKCLNVDGLDIAVMTGVMSDGARHVFMETGPDALNKVLKTWDREESRFDLLMRGRVNRYSGKINFRNIADKMLNSREELMCQRGCVYENYDGDCTRKGTFRCVMNCDDYDPEIDDDYDPDEAFRDMIADWQFEEERMRRMEMGIY